MSTESRDVATFFRRQSDRVGGVGGGSNQLDASVALLDKFKRFEAYGFKRQATAARVETALIAMDAEYQTAIYEAMAEIAPTLHGVFRDQFVPFARDVVARWPRRTGLSKSLVTLTFDLRGGIASASLRSAAPYTTFIRWGKGRTPTGYVVGANVWVSLASSRLRPLAEKMAQAVEVSHG